ncbi:MAG: cyclase family protein [Acidimicrobiales bacterium]
MDLPRYEELPVVPGAPARSSWGLWGDGDVFGCLNLLTPERVAEAARLVRRGKVFPLDWKLELPDPPLYDRQRPIHRVLRDGPWQDDELLAWNTQSSTQWDGFRHVRDRQHGYYAGVPNAEHGVHHWARRGIAGRGVLVDLAARRDLRMLERDVVTVDELADAVAGRVRPGDILLLHFGWVGWYEQADADTRRLLAEDLRCPGLEAGERLLELLWDLHIAAVAADNPSVEAWPPGPDFAHYALLPLLGLPLGEMFDLSGLAADCAEDGVYEGLFTSAPLNLSGGVASPPNALFLK